MARHNKIKLGWEYKALGSSEKVLYHTGMPLRYIKGEEKQMYFKNEPISQGKFLADHDQAAFYNNYAASPTKDQGLTIFNSNPTDDDALEAITKLLKHYVNFHKFSDFEFVHPTEQIPSDPEERASLYIVTGVHHTDPMIMPHVRRWVNYPTGCHIWLVTNAPKAFEWCVNTLGKKPDALFSLQKAVIQVG